MKTSKGKTRPVVTGEYNADGYTISVDGTYYSAFGSSIHDSTQPGTTPADTLPLARLRQHCVKTGKEIAGEVGGVWRGAERSDD